MEFEKETNVKHRSQRWRWEEEGKFVNERGGGGGVASSIQKHAVQQQLTWNLEPRWDDCKVGGGGGRSEKRGVRKS